MMIPSQELVGINSRISDGRYADAYLSALNGMAPVNGVFDLYLEDIAKGKQAVARLVMGTLGHREWENHLVALVMTAAQMGEWHAVDRTDFEYQPGLDAVIRNHFGHVTRCDDKLYLLPSMSYVARCKEILVVNKGQTLSAEAIAR